MIATILLAVTIASAEGHAESNPLYARLVEQGIEAGGTKVKLPPPALPDGLDAAAQKKAIAALINEAGAFDRYAARTPVAPQVIRMSEAEESDEKQRLRRVDVYFIAYGNLDVVDDEEFLKGVFSDVDSAESEGKTLSAEELKAREISLDEQNEAVAYGEIDLIGKVNLSVVGRSVMSRTDGSIVVAAEVDPRFADDAKYANQWRPLVPNQLGKVEPGSPQPYAGAAVYLKATRLAGLEDGIFVEAHLLYTEPYGWFEGKNLLGAKIPAAVTNRVRSLRREFLRQSE